MSTSSGSIQRQQTLNVPQDILVSGNSVWHAGNLAKSEFAPSSHVGSGGTAHAEVTTTTDGFMIAADKVKLNGVSTGANKVTSSTTNGNIQIDGTQTIVYTHPSGDGNLHVPATGTASNTKVLKAGSTAGSISWAFVDLSEATGTLSDTQHGNRGGGSLHAAVTSSTNGFMISTDKSKLDAIQSNAINQTTTDGRYLQLTGGTLTSDLTFSNTSTIRVVINADTDNDPNEDGEPIIVLTQDGGITGAEIKLVQGGTQDNTLMLAPYTGYNTSTPTKNYTVFIHDKKIWHEGTLAKTEFAPSSHVGAGGSAHAEVTTTVDGFMIAADKVKLNGIATGATAVSSSSTNGNITINGTDTNVYTHPTTAGNIHLPSGGATGQYVKYSGTSGTGSWATIDMGDIGTGTLTDTQHGSRGGGTLHALASTTVAGFMDYNDKVKLNGVSTGANKVASSSTNGNIQIDGTETNVYTHPSGDGNMHVPATSTTSNTKVLKAGSTAGSISWANVDWSELTGKPSTFTPPIATSSVLGGVKIGSNLVVAGDGTLTHPTGDGNLHVPATSTTNNAKVLKAGSTAGSMSWASVDWTELTSKPTQFPPSAHTHAISDVTNLSSTLSDKSSLSSANTFTYSGVAIKVQPSAAVGASAVLLQINNSTGGSLVTMGTDTAGESTAKVVINGDLQVTGTTTQSATQNIQGDMNVTGNLSVTGTAVLGSGTSDQTTAKGDFRLEGNFLPIGKYIEVERFPVFGIADDFQFETDSTTFQNVIDHFSTFDTTGGSVFDAPQTGSARYYRLMVSYSSSGTDDSTIQIVQAGTTTSVISFSLPAVNGALDPNSGLGSKARAWKSDYFTTTYTGDTTFQAQKNVSGNLAIRYIEVIAYDYFS